MAMKWRQIALVILGLAVSIAGIWWAFRPQPVGVDLATISRGTLIESVEDEGLAQIRNTYQISTPVAGDVRRIPLTVGDYVEKNAVVATLTPQMPGFLDERSLAAAEAAVQAADAAVLAAKNDVDGAKAELALWQSEWERTNTLFERGIATAQTADQTKFQLEQRKVMLSNAEAILDLRQHQLEQAEAALVEPNGRGDRSTVYELRSPISGQVLAVENDSTRSLPAGANVLTVGNPRDLEIVVDILSTDAVRVVAGAPAIVNGWGQDVELAAEVRRIEPIGFTKVSALGIEEQRVRVHLDIKSDQHLWQSLGHRYRVFVRIQTEKVDDAVLVPSAALFRSNNQWVVFTHEDGIARLRTVTLGARDASFSIALSGIETGMQVILHPNDQLTDGGLIVDRSILQN